MAARTIQVLAPVDYFFDSLDLNKSQTIVVASRLPLGVFEQAILGWRIHSLTKPPVGASIELRALTDGYDTDDPATTIVQPAGSFIGSVLITNTQGRVFDFYSLDLTVSFGQMVRLHLIGTRGANPGPFDVTMSIELACRSDRPAKNLIPPRTYLGHGGFI